MMRTCHAATSVTSVTSVTGIITLPWYKFVIPPDRISSAMSLFPIDWKAVVGVVGFSSSSFNTDTYDYWFLQALFLMRVAVYPVLGHMRTAPVLLCVFLGYAHYVLTATATSPGG